MSAVDWSQMTTPESRAAAERTAKFAALREYAKAKREGGIVVDGMPVSTSPESQNMIAGAVTAMTTGGVTYPIDWHENGEWVQLEAAQVQAIAAAVAHHVQACFSALRVVTEAMTALDDLTDCDHEAAFDAAYAERSSD